MKKILFTRKLIKTSEDYASQLFKVKFNIDDELLTKEEIITQSNDCDGIISTVTEVFDNDIISKLSKRIVIISNFSVGFNNIDIKAAKKRNIIVTNTPDVLTEATAEIAILIILGAARRATEGIKYARNKNWRWSSDFLNGKELNQSNLGILGMGRVGRAVAHRARSFGMKIHYYNRVRLSPDLEKDSVYHDSIKSLFSVSDFLSINCSSTKETKHIINKKTLNYFPNGAVIANSARGEIIEDDSMIEALKNGKVFSLGLDVYNGEPNIHPEYLTLSNVFVLPHLGSATYTTRKAMSDLAIDNIREFFENGNCKNIVN
jgi:glyoxylate reductase